MNDKKILEAMDLYSGKKIGKEDIIVDSINKTETFDIVEASSDGTNKIRKVAISIGHGMAEFNEDDKFLMDAHYEDTWMPIFRVASEDGDIENDYINGVEQLKKIQASIDGGNLDEAKKLFEGFVASAKEIEKKHADVADENIIIEAVSDVAFAVHHHLDNLFFDIHGMGEINPRQKVEIESAVVKIIEDIIEKNKSEVK